MPNKYNFSIKSIAIDKSQTKIVVVIGIAAILTVFSLMFTKTLLAEQSFQSRLIHADEVANSQLETNTRLADQLTVAYNNFEDQTTNIIGGSNSGTGPQDGSNATIVLDALPSQYDFPALASSMTKILSSLNLSGSSISGVDEETTQGNVQPSSNPQPIAIPFSFEVTGASYTSVQDLIKTLEESIRPIQVQSLTIGGNQTSMQVSIQAQTYFQPSKIMGITKETIK